MTDIRPEDILDELVRIAPDVDPAVVALDQPLSDQLDIDSMDFHNLMVALATRCQVDIPEADAARLRTVNAIVAYLRDPARAPRSS
jgi:acyl carrier protein